MKKSIIAAALLAAFLGGILTTLGAQSLLRRPAPESPALEKAKEVYEVLDKCYIGEVDEDVMCDTVAEAMVYATGDRWSYYIPAEEMELHMEQINNAYVGIGVTVQVEEENVVRVMEVVPGGPAFQAGVKVDDVFVSVDGTDCAGLSLPEIRNLVRGEEGSEVQIKMLRNGKELEFNIVRASLQTEVVSDRMIGDTGYIAIYNFDATSAEKAIASVKRLQSQGAKALLFDVRFNPGGLKSELLRLLDFLLPEGTLFRAQDYLGRESVDKSDPDCVDLPMAVLINQDSYSAAEFFAAALSEYGVAETFGTQTCGKGYFQVTKPLSDGSAINLSIGKYFTPNGVSLADVGGLVPDQTVELSEDDQMQLAMHKLDPEEDEQLQAALASLK